MDIEHESDFLRIFVREVNLTVRQEVPPQGIDLTIEEWQDERMVFFKFMCAQIPYLPNTDDPLGVLPGENMRKTVVDWIFTNLRRFVEGRKTSRSMIAWVVELQTREVKRQ